MTGMKWVCCGKSYKDGAVELVAGGSFTGMQSEKVCPHQSKLDVWSYFPFFFSRNRHSEAKHRCPNSSNSKNFSPCASFDWMQPFTHPTLLLCFLGLF